MDVPGFGDLDMRRKAVLDMGLADALAPLEGGYRDVGRLASPAEEPAGGSLVDQPDINEIVADRGHRHRIDRFERDDLTLPGRILAGRNDRGGVSSAGAGTHGRLLKSQPGGDRPGAVTRTAGC